MSNSDMNHMNYLSVISSMDVETLKRKEATYKGSWKKRGGVGAFMMMARKWDRLENILGPMHFDVFGLIEAQVSMENATNKEPGSDGTILAEVRDLRQYLTLIEAEMMARGVVISLVPPTITTVDVNIVIEPKLKGGKGWDDVFISIGDWCVWQRPSDHADIMAKLMGIPRNGRALIDAGQDTEHPDGLTEVSWAYLQKYTPERRVPRYETIDQRVGIDLSDKSTITFEPTITFDQRTPEDGGQHAALTPWIVRTGYLSDNLIPDEYHDRFWHKHATNMHVLEPYVVSNRLPRSLRMIYDMTSDGWLLRIRDCPPDARVYFPNLGREKNSVEWSELPEWQRSRYAWDSGSIKYVLTPANAAWHVEEE